MSQESETTSPTQRAAKRDSLLLMTDFYREDGVLVGPGRVRNISATGLMAECALALQQGDRVHCVLRGAGDLAATVRWVQPGRFGLAFDTPIDPQVVRRPVGMAKPVETPPIFPGRSLSYRKLSS